MNEFIYNFEGVQLTCTIDFDFKDCWSEHRGHYTTKGFPFVESVEHKGEDITELLAEWVIDDIVETFREEQKNEDF